MTADGTSKRNPWCEALGVDDPDLARAKESPDANIYSLLIVALLERGAPMTLEEVAQRFQQAGVAPADRALQSLKRCRPDRPPVYRDGDRYSLDPHDDEAGLWVFRLGLRPAKAPRLSVVRPAPEAPRDPNQPLTTEELDLAWRNASLSTWSSKRLAIAVLDAHGRPMSSDEVVAFVSSRTKWHILKADPPGIARKNSGIRVLEDGRWEIADPAALPPVRRKVRAAVEVAKRAAQPRFDPAVSAALRKAAERRRAAHADELARMRRVLVCAFPECAPEAVALLDIGERRIATFYANDFDTVREQLLDYDMIVALNVRTLLRSLNVDPGARRLGELGPPQKTMQINRRGGKLKITTELLIQGSCGISRPLGDPAKMAGYLETSATGRFIRRLEADAKSMFALYRYGHLHHTVRLRWGFLDEMLPAHWAHRDEPSLGHLKDQAHERGLPLEAVIDSAPGWADPWARARLFRVVRGPRQYDLAIVGDDGYVVDDRDIQLARLTR